MSRRFQYIIFCSAVILLATEARSDMPPKAIQAVCRIHKLDGSVVEGYFSLARGGGYPEGYDSDGFLFIAEDGRETPILFDKEFRGLDFRKGILYRSGSTSSGPHLRAKTVYYLRDTSAGAYGQFDQTLRKQELKVTDGRNIIQREISHRIQYELLDYIPLFLELPEELYLEDVWEAQPPSRIPLAEVGIFEFLESPSEERLEEISEAERRWRENHPDPTGDILPPSWWHILIKQPTVLELLLKKWNF